MKEYRAILFDLDGPICHTDQFHYQAWKVIADQIGVEFTPTDNNRLRGVSRMESLRIILERYPHELSEEEQNRLAEQKNTIYRSLLQQMTPNDLDSETRETLFTLRKQGLKLAIASSSKNAPIILEHLGLDSFFDAVIDGNQITHSKPHPEVFLKAAEAVGVAPDACLVVEDAKAGIEAAIAGGFDSAAIGDAVNCGLATYNLDSLKQLVLIVAIAL